MMVCGSVTVNDHPVYISASLHWSRVLPAMSRVAIPVCSVWVVFPGGMWCLAGLYFSANHTLLFFSSEEHTDSARTFDFLTRDETCTGLIGCIFQYKGWPRQEDCCSFKNFRKARAVTIWCHIMAKHTWLESNPRHWGDRYFILNGKSCLSTNSQDQFLPLGTSGFTNWGGFFSKCENSYGASIICKELYQVQKIKERLGTVIATQKFMKWLERYRKFLLKDD